MADKKISELTTSGSLSGVEEVPLVQGGSTVKSTLTNVKNYVTSSLTKSDVGLSNVDNTTDLNKPISTATQTALNLKQDSLVSGTSIKTVNSTTLLGSGNLSVGTIKGTLPATSGRLALSNGTLDTVTSSASLTFISNVLSSPSVKTDAITPFTTLTINSQDLTSTLNIDNGIVTWLVDTVNTLLIDSTGYNLTSQEFNVDGTDGISLTSGGASNIDLLPNGNVGIRNIAPTATIHAIGVDSTSADYVIKLDNSSSINLFQIANNGYSQINGLNIGKGASQLNSNTVFGSSAFDNVSATGFNNVVFGFQCIQNGTTAQNNVAIGYTALKANTTGNDNVVIGSQAMPLSNSSQNTAVGSYSLQLLSSGNQNTAIGNQSMKVLTTGSLNVGVGYYTLRSNVSGQRNVAIGWNALDLSTNSFNVGVGYRAGANITTGEYNTVVGTDTGATLTTGNYNTIIGRDTARNVSTGSRNTIVGASVTGLTSALSDTIILAKGDGVIRYICDSAGNTGMGTLTPATNAILDLSSTTKAFLPPRMNTTEKLAITSPTGGMVVYDTTLSKLCVYTTTWETITSV